MRTLATRNAKEKTNQIDLGKLRPDVRLRVCELLEAGVDAFTARRELARLCGPTAARFDRDPWQYNAALVAFMLEANQ